MMETAYASKADCVAPRETSRLELVRNGLRNECETLFQTSSRMSDALIQLRGEVPQKGESAKPQPVRSGVLGDIEDLLDTLQRARGQLYEQIAELHKLV